MSSLLLFVVVVVVVVVRLVYLIVVDVPVGVFPVGDNAVVAVFVVLRVVVCFRWA